MRSPARHHRYTYREYLALERHANVRHELVDGEIHAMAGGTPEHAAFCMNVGTALDVQLRGRGCRVHSSDLLIRVLETGLASYPDITVVRGRAELDPEDRNTITNPVVIVEVLSPGTAEYDRGEKLAHYQRIPSLREIVPVAHDERRLEVWRREEGNAWLRSEARSGSIRLASPRLDRLHARGRRRVPRRAGAALSGRVAALGDRPAQLLGRTSATASSTPGSATEGAGRSGRRRPAPAPGGAFGGGPAV